MAPTDTEEALSAAIEAITAGRMVLVLDRGDEPTRGEVCVAGDLTNPEHVGFMAVHARGLVCLTLVPATLRRLGIPLMPADRASTEGLAYGISFEAREGVSTGISAADRAATIRVAVDARSGPDDVVMPGHIPPIEVSVGGVMERPGPMEAAQDLVRLAGRVPAATVCTVLDEDGEIAAGRELLRFAETHGLVVVSVEGVLQHRLRTELLVERLDETELERAEGGRFRAIAYRNKVDESEHLALVRGRLRPDEPALVRVHSQCLTGDVFGSRRCDCGEQLMASLDAIAENGRGILVYLHQEGRGIGLANKIRAYALQDDGLDTVEANLELGFDDDQRDYGISAQILRDLGVSRVRLMTNNERKIRGLARYGVEVVERVACEVQPHPENIEYLRTKQEKLGHLLTGLDGSEGESS